MTQMIELIDRILKQQPKSVMILNISILNVLVKEKGGLDFKGGRIFAI